MRVGAGAIARKILGDNVTIKAGMVQMGHHSIDRERLNWDETRSNPLFCPDPVAAEHWAAELDKIRKAGSSVGAVIEVVADGVPAGWGAPVYGKLDADLASAMMSINAAKGVEIGAGMAAAALTGEENADQMRPGREGGDGMPEFLSNNAGGILGGISTGQQIVARFSVKPTSSILTPRKSITEDGEATDVMTKGRHDPCVGIRAVPIAEAMMAIVLADHMMLHRAQCG
jgi:chorismate synthase